MKAIHMMISGRVQAVGFRAFVKRNAKLLELTGWVRNCDDGKVEVFAQGNEEKLERFQELCSLGPPTAEVINVEAEASASAQHSEFRILC